MSKIIGVVPPPADQIRNLYRSAGQYLLAMANVTDEQHRADPDLGPQHLMMAIECARKADAIERYQAEQAGGQA